jgi:predicted phage terminase large subunit-like protein
MSDAGALQAEIDELCRHDFGMFIMCAAPHSLGQELEHNWHIDALAYTCSKAAEPGPMRQIINLPPRYLKTFVGSVCLIAWLLGRDPKAHIINISYSAVLAEKFGADTLRLMQSDWYQRVFPGTKLERKSRELLTTTAGGARIATSVGGTLTGRGANVIIADDLLNAGQAHSVTARENTIEWFRGTVLTRFNDPQNGKLIVIGQRLHAEDPPGQLMAAGGWDTLIIPAIAQRDMTYDMVKGGKKGRFDAGSVLMPSRHSLADLEQLKREMGEHDFEAQFNQQPLPPGGAVFKAQWLKRYDEPPVPAATQAIIQSWDTAWEGDEHNDYSVCTTWAICPDGFYLLDVWRDRPAFWQLEKIVNELRAKWRAHIVVVEKAASGIGLIQNIREREGKRWLTHVNPASPKLERAQQHAYLFEQGRVHLPRQADWLGAFEAELLAFPHCKHDDQVDSTVQFLFATRLGSLMRNVELFGRT